MNFKNVPRNSNASICDISMQLATDSVVFKLVKMWPLTKYLSSKRVQISIYTYIERLIKNLFMNYNVTFIIICITLQTSSESDSVDSKFLKPWAGLMIGHQEGFKVQSSKI